MINDITALRFDVRLAKVCAAHKAPLVLMHSIGLPGEMPHIVGMPNTGALPHTGGITNTGKLENVMGLVSSNLKASIEIAEEMGCTQLLLDPGFGFGKSFTDNLRLMADLNSLCELGWPVLIGVSRKNSVGLTIAKDGIVPPPAERIFASLGVASVGVDSGACILRTHDVQPTVEFLKGRAITLQTAQTSVSYHTMSSIQPSNSKED